MYSVNNDSTNYVLIQSMTEGQLPSSLIFRNGKEFVLVDFFPDNSLKEIKTAIKKRGELKLHGMHLAYFINGAIRESSSWKNGVRHGITERFNRMGVVVEKYEFRKGKRVTPNIVGLYSE